MRTPRAEGAGRWAELMYAATCQRAWKLGSNNGADNSLNSTENSANQAHGRRCLTPLSPHRNYILSISLYDFFRSVSGTRQIGCKIKLHQLVLRSNAVLVA